MIWGWAGPPPAPRPATSCATRGNAMNVLGGPLAPVAGIWVATGLLFALSAIFQPESLGASALAALWPFAAVLILAAVGQTLVVQQRGIDLSVPGFISLTVVLVTHIPNGNSCKLSRRSCSPTRSPGRRPGQRAAGDPGRDHPDRADAGHERRPVRGRPGHLAGHADADHRSAAVVRQGDGRGHPAAAGDRGRAGPDHRVRRQAHQRSAAGSRPPGPTRRPPGRRACAAAATRSAPTSARPSCTARPACCWPASCPSPTRSRATTTCCRRWRRWRWAARRCSAAGQRGRQRGGGAVPVSQLQQFVLATGANAAVQNLVQAGALALAVAVYGLQSGTWQPAAALAAPGPAGPAPDATQARKHSTADIGQRPRRYQSRTKRARRGPRRGQVMARPWVQLLALALAACGSSGGRLPHSSGGGSSGAPRRRPGRRRWPSTLVRPKEDHDRPRRRVRRQHLAGADPLLRVTRPRSARA